MHCRYASQIKSSVYSLHAQAFISSALYTTKNGVLCTLINMQLLRHGTRHEVNISHVTVQVQMLVYVVIGNVRYPPEVMDLGNASGYYS